MEHTGIITTSNVPPVASLVGVVMDSLSSKHSRRAYGRALNDFLTWYSDQGNPGLNKTTVQRYKTVLQDSGKAPATVNQRITAIRKLAQEAADNGWIEQALAAGVARVKGVTSHGVRAGNWLTREQAQALINSPNLATLKGIRDRAMLAVMLGAGLRRSEVASLTFAHIQQRDARWCIVDLVGKGNRVRTVPIPSWVRVAVDDWSTAAGIDEGRVFRPVRKGGFLNGVGITTQSVYEAVKLYADRLGYRNLAAHDLRRTFAKLAYKGGAGLDQIQFSLGHADVKTTQIYVGAVQDLADAPCDHLGLKV